MQKSFFLIVALAMSLAGGAVAQDSSTKPSAPQGTPPPAASRQAAPQQPATPPEPSTPPTEPVITIEGLCNVKVASAKAAQSTPPCRRQVSRADFEKLFRTPGTALQPAEVRQSIAKRYTDLLMAANEGEKLGGENDTQVLEQLELQRLTVMAQFAQRKLAEEAQKVTDEQAKAFYDAHTDDFDEVTLTRIFIPRSSSSGKDVDTKQLADQVEQQMIAGGDPEKIQKAVYDALKTTSEVPTTKFGAKRRGTLPATHDAVFHLNAGQVSGVLSDPIGYVVYKVEAKRLLPFEEVKAEARRSLAGDKFRKEEERIRGAVKIDYNEGYFGAMPTTPASAATSGAKAPSPATPKSQPASQRKAGTPAPKK